MIKRTQKNQTFELTEPQRQFLERGVSKLQNDPRIVGVAAGGSFLLGEMDEFSDLDLVLYIEDEHYQSAMKERESIAAGMGSLLQAFTGEHVGEPRLLICLYGPPLLHIDLKFVALKDIQEKVENPTVIWERDKRISSKLELTEARFPQPDSLWIEHRFWTWIHYTATKIGRGELFEAVEAIGFLRVQVLGPMLLKKHAARPQGLRKLERVLSPQEQEQLEATIPRYDSLDCIRALRKSVELYCELRSIQSPKKLEKFVMEYVDQIGASKQ